MSGGDWKPIYVSFSILFVLGIILPFVINSVIDVNPDDISGFASYFYDMVENGVDLPVLPGSINIFSAFGETLQNALLSYIATLGYIPEVILIPMIILITFGFLYTIIKLLPTT